VFDMVFLAILSIVLSIIGAIGSIVFPALPRSFFVYWDSGIGYLRQGIRFIAQFLNMSYVNNLLSWWISLAGVFLGVELIYGVWQLIMGAGHHTMPGSFADGMPESTSTDLVPLPNGDITIDG